MSKYGHRSHNWFEAIVNKLGGEESADKFLAGELVVSFPARVWKTWRKVKLGTGLKTVDDFRKAIKQAGMKIGDWGNDILGKPVFTVSPEEVEVDLINVSVAELGFKDGATYKDICVRARELGLELCPNEVGPQLRLQYKDQPKGEWLLVAMEAISGSLGRLRVFGVGHDGGVRWFCGDDGHPDGFWRADDRFLFLRRKVA